jgi:hypothetical protein
VSLIIPAPTPSASAPSASAPSTSAPSSSTLVPRDPASTEVA